MNYKAIAKGLNLLSNTMTWLFQREGPRLFSSISGYARLKRQYAATLLACLTDRMTVCRAALSTSRICSGVNTRMAHCRSALKLARSGK